MTDSKASIVSKPRPGQLVEHDGQTYKTIKEGLACILIPPNTEATAKQTKSCPDGDPQEPQGVFYNPIQQFNRDLSVLVIRAFGQDLCERRAKKIAAKQKRQRDRPHSKKQNADHGPTVSVDDDANPNGQTADPSTDRLLSHKRKAHDDDPILDGQGADTSTDQPQSKKRKANHGAPISPDEVAPLDGRTNHDDSTVTTHAPNGNQAETEVAADPPAVPSHLNNNDRATPRPPPFRILDALSATGLRALRYAHELDFVTHVTANDLSTTATDAIRLNVAHNNLQTKIKPITADARAHMYSSAYSHKMHEYHKYDAIDLDPYGTAVPFLEAAIEALNDNGLLCVTCTDASVFASMSYLEKSYALYGGLPIKGLHSHEAGLRLILNSIATIAAKHSKAIEPLLSLSIDFYARVFVRVRRSPSDVKLLAGKSALVHQCDAACGAWSIQPLARNSLKPGRNGQEYIKYTAAQSATNANCEHCGTKTHLAGPMWMGPLHNPFFVSKILSGLHQLDDDTYGTKPRIEGMLTSALDELEVLPDIAKYKVEANHVDDSPKSMSTDCHTFGSLPASTLDPHPFFFTASAASKVLHCVAPPEAAIKGALRRMGYVATRSHTKPGCIKTQAPWKIIWHVMREWVRQEAPIKPTAHSENSPGWKILGLGAGPNNGMTAEIIDTENTQPEPQPEPQQKTAVVDGKKPEELPPVVFDTVLGRDEPEAGKGVKRRKLTRYQLNPRANWGPMTRAGG